MIEQPHDREAELGKHLADALVQHAVASSNDARLDSRAVVRAASERLAHHVSRTDIDWHEWAAKIDVRGDEQDKRLN